MGKMSIEDFRVWDGKLGVHVLFEAFELRQGGTAHPQAAFVVTLTIKEEKYYVSNIHSCVFIRDILADFDHIRNNVTSVQ